MRRVRYRCCARRTSELGFVDALPTETEVDGLVMDSTDELRAYSRLGVERDTDVRAHLKRLRWPAAATILAMLGLAACGGSSTTASSSSSSAPIQIGSIWSLTGAAAGANVGDYNVMQLIVQDLNNAGGINGHRIDVTYGDDQSDPGTATVVMKQMIQQDHIQMFIGPGYTPPTLAAATLAEANHVVMFSPGAQAPQLTQPLQKYIFAADPPVVDIAQNVVTLLTSLGAKKPGIIAVTGSYGTNAIAASTAALQPSNEALAATSMISATATDATTEVAQMQAAGVDAIIGGVAAEADYVAIWKAMVHANFNVPFIGFATFGGVDKVLAEYPAEAFLWSPLACPLTGSCVASFVAEFHKNFPQDAISVQDVWAYVSISAFFAALKTTTSYTADAVVRALETAPAYSSSLIPETLKWTSTSHLAAKLTSFEGYKSGQPFFFGININQNHFGS